MAYFGSLNELTDKEVFIKGVVRAELVSCGDKSVTVRFTGDSESYTPAVAFAILDTFNKSVWYDKVDLQSDTYTMDISDLDFLSYKKPAMRFKLYLVFESDNILTLKRLYNPSIKSEFKATSNKRLLFYDVVAQGELEGEKELLAMNITSNGFFGFALYQDSRKLNYCTNNCILNFDVVDDKFCFDLKLEKYSLASKMGISLLASPKTEDAPEVYYEIQPTEVEEHEEYCIFKCRYDRHFLNLENPEVLKLRVFYDLENGRYYTNIKTVTPELSLDIRRLAIVDNGRENMDLMEFTFRSNNNELQFVNVIPNIGKEITTIAEIDDLIMAPDFVANRVMFGDHSVENDEYYLHFNADMSTVDNVKVFVYNSKTKEKVILDTTRIDNSSFKATFENMKENVRDFSARAYLICASFSYNGYLYCARIKSADYVGDKTDENLLDLHERVLPSVASFNVGETLVILEPMYSQNGFFYVRLRDSIMSRKDLDFVKLQKLKFKDSKLLVSADITDSSYDFVSFALSYRYKKSEDKQVHFEKAIHYTKKGRNYIKATFDLSKIDLRRIIWDIFAVYKEGENLYFASISVDDKQIDNKLFSFKNLFAKNDYRMKTDEGTDVFFPYFTTINTIAFMVREQASFDSRLFKIKEFIAMVIYKLFKKHFRQKKIILTYEKFCNCAQDNGYCFFKHCMEHGAQQRLDAEIYYVIDKKSGDYQRVKKYDKNVIDFLSLKHMIYLLSSRLLVSSDSIPHIYAWRPNCSPIEKFVKQKKLFFLQHGVLALKRVDFLYGRTKPSAASVFVTSSNAEKNIVTKIFGYAPEEVCVTGLARWDELEDKSQNCREILLMPTWRSWLDEIQDSDFVKSDYYKRYMEFLHSERLKKILEDNDLNLNFYIHPKFKDYIGNFNVDSNRIRIIPYGEEPLNELMMRCKLLITDYSSVCWDVFYMNKPILFYQFDYDVYNSIHGSYINMETELFGDRSLTLDKLLDDLEKSISMNFKLPYEYKLMREDSFAFIDKNNCSRIVQEIRHLKW
ncbi:MAG: CDP-glycerol glycerophosphotransferase family protein [Ruminococcus sp.]